MVLAYGSLNEFDSASIYLDLFAVLKDSLKIKQIKEPKSTSVVEYESEFMQQQKKLIFYRRALIIASVTVFILILLIFFIKGHNRKSDG